MAISKETLVARREELTKGLEQMKAQAAAIQGALADVDYWLSQLDAEIEPKPAKRAKKE